MYLAYHNMPDIALADTCYSLKKCNFYNTERWESKRISIDIYMAQWFLIYYVNQDMIMWSIEILAI
jgi:hypothetical protein